MKVLDGQFYAEKQEKSILTFITEIIYNQAKIQYTYAKMLVFYHKKCSGSAEKKKKLSQ